MARRRVSHADREHFRRYLERSGVVDSLTTVFVSLYEQQEKPAQALEYVKERLDAVTLTSPHTQALQQEANNLRQRCECLEEENKDLKAKLQQYEPDAPEDDEPEDDEPEDDEPDAPEDDEPDAPEDDEPDAPEDDEPDAPEDDEPDAPEDDEPDAPEDDEPDAPEDDEPDAPEDDEPDAPEDDEPDAPEDDEPDAPEDGAAAN